MTRHSAAGRRRSQQHAPDGTPTRCGKGCGRQVMWFDTQYSTPAARRRVCLDVDPVEADSQLARYRVDWDAITPIAHSVKKSSYLPDHPEQPRYSAHFDTCTGTRSTGRR